MPFLFQALAIFLIKPPPDSDLDSMMPLVSPMNDVELDDQEEGNGNNYFPSEPREENSPLVDVNGEGKLI
jgi:hypothetical protein